MRAIPEYTLDALELSSPGRRYHAPFISRMPTCFHKCYQVFKTLLAVVERYSLKRNMPGKEKETLSQG